MAGWKTGVAAALLVAMSGAAWAKPLKLKPANPQPSGLSQGLAVQYAFPEDVKSLRDADVALKMGTKAGKPLAGLDYRDTIEGDPALTSGAPFHVVAHISGYVKFDAPGNYVLDFLTNDGLRMSIGGREVAMIDERRPCEPIAAVEVSVPEAGWYDLDAVWFQRLGTSCLHMRWAPEGSSPDWTPNSAFGFK